MEAVCGDAAAPCRYIVSFMKRAHALRSVGITPVFVFDGGRLPGKAGEEADRARCQPTPLHIRRHPFPADCVLKAPPGFFRVCL